MVRPFIGNFLAAQKGSFLNFVLSPLILRYRYVGVESNVGGKGVQRIIAAHCEPNPTDNLHSKYSPEFQSSSPNQSFISTASLQSPDLTGSLDSDKPAVKPTTHSKANNINTNNQSGNKSPALDSKTSSTKSNGPKSIPRAQRTIHLGIGK